MALRRLLTPGLSGLLLLTLACKGSTTTGLAGVELIPVSPTATASPMPRATPPHGGWEQLAPGIEWRGMSVPVQTEEAEFEAPVTMVRLAPAQVTIRVHYAPDAPATIRDWQMRLPFPAVIVNGGFFLEDGAAIGVLVSDGVHHNDEPGYQEWGGLFAVADGRADVRSHAQSPYHPGEAFTQVVEGYPMLLDPGASPVLFESDPTRLAQRTVVAATTDGRILLMVIGVPGIPLANLREWLGAEAGSLGIDTALNLDGGRSTGLAVRAGEVDWLLESYVEVPTVIAVYVR